MTVHLTARLVWHDRAWDGHVCDQPSKNVYYIAHQHVREVFRDPAKVDRWHAAHLTHRTKPTTKHPNGVLVQSKSEVIVANILTDLGLSWDYEQKLFNKANDPTDFRWPDFTVSYQGDTFYWEHRGILGSPKYKEKWERKDSGTRTTGTTTNSSPPRTG